MKGSGFVVANLTVGVSAHMLSGKVTSHCSERGDPGLIRAGPGLLILLTLGPSWCLHRHQGINTHKTINGETSGEQMCIHM